jgi:hypothetical protein
LDVDPCPTHPPPMATKFLANFEKLIILLLWVPTMTMNIANDDIANYVVDYVVMMEWENS